ncbi:MAG: carbamoyltransferase HypF [Phycisphaerae bacterium]|nr:carbamoyltransferase HypF [Phycisphaerae bacterium]
MIQRQTIRVTGRVQGVGFRPAVYRLARDLALTGRVFNDTKGVTVELQGPPEAIDEFLRRLQGGADKPPLARIRSCRRVDIEPVEGETGFAIEKSDSQGTALSQVTPDIATCGDCLAELFSPADFRYRYPFINCTNCGPRYSIIKTIPYDRPNTTMSSFEMCGRCAAQYRDMADRRFHAQPVACPQCGPKIWLADPAGKALQTGTDGVITEAARLLRAGKIVAIKGVGGFHLACDALNNDAVLRLRQRKRRDHKPFAMMVRSVEDAKEYAFVDQAAEQVLRSPQSPIVLLPKRVYATPRMPASHAASGRPDPGLAPSVAQGVGTVGFMLCYAPLHHLLFAEGLDVLVMTSANLSDEPLICRNELALERLGDVADAFLMHDREIYRQVDDSIVQSVAGEPALLRRARGYVPTPIFMPEPAPQEVLATGADLKNTFCFAKHNQLILSEHIGDLEDAEVYHHYVGSIRHLAGLFEVEPKVVACDLHPGYLSTQYAKSLPGVRVIQVQHHWAHIASVLAEHGLAGPVIGLECDGTGYGTDGAIWGCECMIASLTQFRRFGHLAYYPLPGGDKASKEPIRPLLSLLRQAYGDDFTLDRFAWLLERVESGHSKMKLILEQIDKRINTVSTSSLGRVFDAVAALLGLGNYNHFDAQLPMALESLAEPGIEDRYESDLPHGAEPLQLDLRRTLKGVVEDLRSDRTAAVISAKFHNTLAEALLVMAKAARESTRLEVAALSGGVFCNRFLTDRLVRRLKQEGFAVLGNRSVPSNDGGIALGQAAIAARIVTR